MDHNAKNMQFWLSGGGGAGLIIKYQTGPIFLPSYPLAYINIHVTCGNTPIRMFRAFDDVFADTVKVAA